jgi:hypothetical protein
MAQNRLPQDLQTREAEVRPQAWVDPDKLPSPKPQAGWSFRYIRISTRGEADATNFSSQIRSGWEPCKAVDHPEIQILIVENAQFKDNIVIGGLMLCKQPKERIAAREASIQKKNDNQMRAVDHNFMKENNPVMPLFSERKSKVTFGSGNQT